MNRYEVQFREEIRKTAFVYAENEEDAEELVSSGEYLDDGDYIINVKTESEEFITVEDIKELT